VVQDIVIEVYIYKLTVDDGGAPCVHDGVWSLAICKPAIRSTAQEDNVILGFSGNDLYKNNSLIYIARVTLPLGGRKYFRDKYASRPDCIYEWDGRRFDRRPDAKFHSSLSDQEHDLGTHPNYKRATVLLSAGKENFRYFGDKCPVEYKSKYPRLKSLINGLGQGHRVNFGSELKKELQQFMKQLWQVRFRYREPIIKDRPCRDSCSAADEKYVVGEC
jgi:hypothetical protein